MARKKSPRSVVSVLGTMGSWFAKPVAESSPVSHARSRGRRLGYESLEGRVVLSASPGALIQGEVYNDLNGQGQTSDGPGLAGVTINLFHDGGDGKFEGTTAGTDDTLVGTQQTNAAGNYNFSGLSAGTYFVQEIAPAGFVLPANASNPQTVVISAAAAAGTPGVTIDSFATGQTVDASSLTSTSSTSSVTAPEAVGGRRDQSVQLTSAFGDVNLSSDAYNQHVMEFNSSATATGIGTVTWDGSNATPGVLNPTGLNGVDLTSGGKSVGIQLAMGADHDNASVTLNIYTDANDWSTVTEAIPYTAGAATQYLYLPFSSFTTGAGTGANFSKVGAVQLQFTGSTGAHAEVDTISAVGPTVFSANFANYQPASVGDLVFWDMNSSGIHDSSEPGAANVNVQLLQSGSVVATTTSNAQGGYQFSGLAPGNYSVKFNPSNGTLFTTEGVGSNPNVNSDANPASGATPTFSLTSGENDTTRNAGLLPIDLSIVKTVNNPAPTVGSNVNFTITLSNASGLSQATGVTVNDALPAGLTFVSATPSQGTYNSSSGVWTVGTLASGASTSLTITATVTSAGLKTNIVEVASADEADTAPASNLQSSASVTPVLPADLQLTKTVDNPTPNVGQNVVFTQTLTDLGPGGATNVATTDVLPAGLTFVSASANQGTYNSGTGVWTIGSVANGSVETLQITATVATPGTKTNVATITSDGTPDSNPNNNQGTAIVTPQVADLSLTKTVDNSSQNVGQNVTFTITVSNSGPNAATDVVTTDPLPAGLTFVSDTVSQGTYNSATGLWTIGTMASGATPVTMNLTATVSTPGTKTNTATVTGDQYDPNLGNNTGSATVTPGVADLSLTKTVDNSTQAVGQNVTFTITVNNAGPTTATHVTTTDVLPAGLTFVSDTTSQGTYNPTTGVWTIGTMQSGATPVTLNLTATVATGGAKTNTATVTGDQYDPNLGNNTGSATVTPPGDIGSFAFWDLNKNGVRDASDTGAANVTVQLLHNGSVIASTVTNSQGSYEFAGIAPGTYNVKFTAPNGASYTVENASPNPAVNSNVNTATGITPAFNLASGQDDLTRDAGLLPVELSVTKTVNNATPVVGSNVQFTITISNAAGFSQATGVTVGDPLPAGLAYVSATAAEGTYNSSTGVWNVGVLPSGASTTLIITATVTGAGLLSNTATITNVTQPDPNGGPPSTAIVIATPPATPTVETSPPPAASLTKYSFLNIHF